MAQAAKNWYQSYIEAGAAGVHFEDQLGSEKKCGHMGGKVLIPTAQHIRHLNAARLAADVCGAPTIVVARTDAESSRLLTRYELGALGFKYQFITLAGFHANSYSMFDLARNYKEKGMLAYSSLQQQEFAAEQHGYSAVKHQREVGTGYFDHISNAVTGGQSSTTALAGSTEEAQFHTATASSEDEEILR
ncbi:isocitrate lyase family protein [Teladorsagia circumcincta]|uniref:isocitrate lyase n=1 Tax=Teladorsagia circumcincta TaxID=45464 RepID=A0A2G9TLJ1_TELCI|nr:isocitrate lyase family protein [Teladorsagia circumcincta]